MTHRTTIRTFATIASLLLLAGCDGTERVPLAPVPIEQSVATVNANIGRIDTTLKATGAVRGHFTTTQGRRQPYDLHASVQVLAPNFLYGSFKSGLGTEEMLLGSNSEKYWLYVKRDNDTYRVGRYALVEDSLNAPLPLRPDMLIEALGLKPIPYPPQEEGPYQRVVDEYQQLIFVDPYGPGAVTKEYWIERYNPRLIRRVLFRDSMGRILMDSNLSQYQPAGEQGPWLPRKVDINWPQHDSELRFSIHRWEPLPDRGPDHPAFVAPHERGQTFPRMIDFDSGLPLE